MQARKQIGTWYTATRNYSSGMIQSKQNFHYGKFEIRCKLPSGNGFWPSFWMWGGDECDVFEYCTSEPTIQQMTLHMNCDGHDCQSHDTNDGINSTDGFHTYSVEWEPLYVEWKTDGQTVRKVNLLHSISGGIVNCGDDLATGIYTFNELIPDDFMEVIAGLGVNTQGSFCGNNIPDENTPFPADYEVDYIRIWQKNPQQGLYDLCADRQIQGSDVICSAQQITYSFNGIITLPLSWSVSPNLTIVSQTDNSITVQPLNNSLNENAWIKALTSEYEPCPQTEFIKSIWIGKPIVNITSSPSYKCPVLLTARVQPLSLIGNWSVTGTGPYYIYGNQVEFEGSALQSTNYQYQYSASNGCGEVTKSGQKYLPICSDRIKLLVSPNPANQSLSINIEGSIQKDDIEFLI
ncbi:MAG: glycoside hydrolase family 16 protein [Saprospiraceae bacterium]|nr:glycoside hydrolase family 16 protein [Saprospiraceae bacterium]MBP7699832.1 glycoside hydrolase family 16 protein [Saprospiraceae bacterium]